MHHPLFASEKDLHFLRESSLCLGITRHFETGTEPEKVDTVTQVEQLDFANLTRAMVKSIVQDFAVWLDDLISRNQGHILQIQINLADAAGPWAAKQLRARGFCLGGHLPQWRCTDYLMLQLLHTAPDLDAVQVMPGPGSDILEQIRGEIDENKGSNHS